MRPLEALNLHREEIRHIVEARHARNPRVFGSVVMETIPKIAISIFW